MHLVPLLAGQYAGAVKTTAYFEAIRTRPDRRIIKNAWIERAIDAPIRQVPEMENRYLRVILLADGATVHKAFFDRRFIP